jgi:hypothetical protein
LSTNLKKAVKSKLIKFQLQGVLLGLSNTAGVLAGVFGTAATGYILQRGKTLLQAS